MLDWVGWIATAMFVSSYFCKKPATLRSVQAVAALIWICYGLIIGSAPVIVANALVASVAAYSAWRTYTLKAETRP